MLIMNSFELMVLLKDVIRGNSVFYPSSAYCANGFDLLPKYRRELKAMNSYLSSRGGSGG